jgi:hypothetical protein
MREAVFGRSADLWWRVARFIYGGLRISTMERLSIPNLAELRDVIPRLKQGWNSL